LPRTSCASGRALTYPVAQVSQLALLVLGKPPDPALRLPGLLLRLSETRLVTVVGRHDVELCVALPEEGFVERSALAARANVGERPAIPVRPLPVENEGDTLALELALGERAGLGPVGLDGFVGIDGLRVSTPISLTLSVPGTVGLTSMVSPSTTLLTVTVSELWARAGVAKMSYNAIISRPNRSIALPLSDGKHIKAGKTRRQCPEIPYARYRFEMGISD
jgi:hypothetical protein